MSWSAVLANQNQFKLALNNYKIGCPPTANKQSMKELENWSKRKGEEEKENRAHDILSLQLPDHPPLTNTTTSAHTSTVSGRANGFQHPIPSTTGPRHTSTLPNGVPTLAKPAAASITGEMAPRASKQAL